MSGYRIDEIEGIGEATAKTLALAEIRSTEALLRACAKPGGRRRVARETGLTEARLLKWANMADLLRVKGVGPEYAELLEAAGVDTVKELRNRNPASLAGRMGEINEAKRLVRRMPTADQVASWIAEASRLDPAIFH